MSILTYGVAKYEKGFMVVLTLFVFCGFACFSPFEMCIYGFHIIMIPISCGYCC